MDNNLQKLEVLRRKASASIVSTIAIAIFITYIFLLIFSTSGSPTMALFISVPIGLVSGFLFYKLFGCQKKVADYRGFFKSIFVEAPFRNAFEQITYQSDQGFDKELIKNTGLMCLGNIYTTNDYMQGYYKDVRFERADVKIQQHVSNGKTSYTVTYFNGRWLILDFNKEFQFDLQILTKGFYNSKKKGSFFTSDDERRHRIELEDVEFNEMFHVFGQDDHEAFYILTPQFMAILKDMASTLDGEFMFGFINNQLHIAINTGKDAMEHSVLSRVNSFPVEQEVQKEINVIITIIDGLDLDSNIFKI
ncbi:MAG: DUF3137 domain-containing protein [Mobilitalea sp.]